MRYTPPITFYVAIHCRKHRSSRTLMGEVCNIDTGSIELPALKRGTGNVNSRLNRLDSKIQALEAALPPLVEPERDKGEYIIYIVIL